MMSSQGSGLLYDTLNKSRLTVGKESGGLGGVPLGKAQLGEAAIVPNGLGDPADRKEGRGCTLEVEGCTTGLGRGEDLLGQLHLVEQISIRHCQVLVPPYNPQPP